MTLSLALPVRRALRLMLFLVAAFGLAGNFPVAAQPSSPPLELAYTLRVKRPSTSLVEIEIRAGKVSTESLDFVMPAWGPGRYAIYDFAKNVQEFSARGAAGQSLSWTKLDKQTWRVDTRAANGSVDVTYRVFAHDLSGSFSDVDSTHACLNGPSIFMYVDGHKPDALSLKVEAPAAWKVYSGFSMSAVAREFRAPNYDVLVDTPLEISPECTLDQFEEQGKTIQVVVHAYGEDHDRARLVEGLKKLVHLEMAAMPPPDLAHYVFIFHFAPDVSLGDGMEHLNSTQIVVQGTVRDGTQEALETAAHEFFHTWNVKRFRPVELGPFDYTRENYSRSLWFVEGATTYYGYLFLLRSGIWTRQQFLTHLANEMGELEREPGRELMSAESSSFHAWFYDRSPQMQQTNFANTTISYYNKGALIALLLDLEIRGRTEGRKSLLDVFQTLYHKFYEAPPASYYGPGRGYEPKDLEEAASAVSGTDFSAFFERYVRGTDSLPYADALREAGFELRRTAAPDAAPTLGVAVQTDNQGARIAVVYPGSAAERAGLSRDDLLVDVDDQSLATEDLSTRLRAYPPGATVPFTVQRHGKRETVNVTLDPPRLDQFSLVPAATATPAQVSLRDAWLATP